MRQGRGKPRTHPHRSLALLLTGALMVFSVFALANPAFGVWSKEWPWQAFFGQHLTETPGGWRLMVIAGVWLLAGCWSVLLSFRGPLRLRALGASALATLLLLVCAQGHSPFALLSTNPGTMAPLILLGAGLWLARDAEDRLAARSLAAAGGLLVAWGLFANEHGPGWSQFGGYLSALSRLGQDLRAGINPPAPFWASFLPQTLMYWSAAFGLVVALGLSMRRTTTVFFLLLAVGLLLPGAMLALGSIDPLPDRQAAGSLERLMGHLLGAGSLLWLLGVFALADLARSLPGQDDLEWGL